MSISWSGCAGNWAAKPGTTRPVLQLTPQRAVSLEMMWPSSPGSSAKASTARRQRCLRTERVRHGSRLPMPLIRTSWWPPASCMCTWSSRQMASRSERLCSSSSQTGCQRLRPTSRRCAPAQRGRVTTEPGCTISTLRFIELCVTVGSRAATLCLGAAAAASQPSTRRCLTNASLSSTTPQGSSAWPTRARTAPPPSSTSRRRPYRRLIGRRLRLGVSLTEARCSSRLPC
mmetsp:Transcript_4639/g.10195  ORF Transcript_4639/g.10195 Transcript_4639/m.10195 type:complete len:230 (+) Transcript_4639:182-871(+)